MKNLNKFLRVLDKKCTQFEWYGWEKGENKSSFNRLGIFVAWQGRVSNFDITIAHHDYSKSDRPLPVGVLCGRRVPTGARHWFEITILDYSARFGRKTILVKQVIAKGSDEYELICRIFGKINKPDKIFRGNTEDRMSPERALGAVCEELEKVSPLV